MGTNSKRLTASLAVLAVLGLGTAAFEWRATRIQPATAAVAAARPAKTEAGLQTAAAHSRELEQQLEKAQEAHEKAADAVKAATADLAERQALAARPEPTGPQTGVLYNWGPVFAKLNLEPLQRARVARLLNEFEVGPGGTDWNRLFRNYTPASEAESQAILDAFRIDFGTAFKGQAGDDAYAEIQRYRRTPEQQIRQLTTQTSNQSGEPLSDANKERLIALVLANAAFQHIGILSLEFHVDKLSRPLL